jgi:hypothetical protein
MNIVTRIPGESLKMRQEVCRVCIAGGTNPSQISPQNRLVSRAVYSCKNTLEIPLSGRILLV